MIALALAVSMTIPDARTPRLHASGDGLLLSYQQDGALKLWDGRGTVELARDEMFVNWADFPSVSRLDNGSVLSHWLRKVPGETYAYHVMVSTSVGAKPLRLHSDKSASEHGFATLLPGKGGRFTAIWLDGRRTTKKGPQALYAAEWDGRRLVNETELDAKVCDCCSTAAVRAGDAIVAAYRDRADDETRDISIVRYEGGRWSAPAPLHRDGWVIKGCPVNGPALAARGRRVAAVWYTMQDKSARVRLAFSEDAGRSWGAPMTIDEGDPSGRVDAVMLEDGSAVAAWLEGGRLLARRARPGARGRAVTLVEMGSSRSSGYPRLALSGGRLVAAWTASAGGKPSVRVESFDIPALPGQDK